MRPLFETVTDLEQGADALRRRRYGVIEVAGARLAHIRLRPFPKLASLPEVLLLSRLVHAYRRGDRCLLYYNQPWRFSRFLAVGLVVSRRGTTYATFRRALQVLDEIARLKGADALLANVANWRISRRLLERLGWEPHCPSRWQRHYIKRFYGAYSPRPEWAAQRSPHAAV